MNLSNSIIIAVVVLALITGAYFLGRSHVEPVEIVKTERHIDTVYEPKYIDVPKVTVKPYYIVDTVVNNERIIDTVYYTDHSGLPVLGAYEARHDTTAADSSYTLSLTYKSDIPLSVNGYFTYRLGFRDRTIREKESVYLERPKTVWDYVKLSIYTGVGYGITTQKFDMNIGAGLTITPFN